MMAMMLRICQTGLGDASFSFSPTLTFERAEGARPFISSEQKFRELVNTAGSWVEPAFLSVRLLLSNEVKVLDLTFGESIISNNS